jgi:hypothetical protein
MRKLPFIVSVIALFFSSAKADIITTLNFVSPSGTSPITVLQGSSVTFDLGVSFSPAVAPTTGTPSFFDLDTDSPVSSCVGITDCEEIQINTSASTLVTTSVFAEALAGTVPGPPTFYPFTSLGTFPITVTYPNVGTWEITTAGATDEEQFEEQECTTNFVNGVAQGSPSCSTIDTIDAVGAFDPGGNPELLVNVVAAPEPPYGLAQGAALLGLALIRRFSNLKRFI